MWALGKSSFNFGFNHSLTNPYSVAMSLSRKLMQKKFGNPLPPLIFLWRVLLGFLTRKYWGVLTPLKTSPTILNKISTKQFWYKIILYWDMCFGVWKIIKYMRHPFKINPMMDKISVLNRKILLKSIAGTWDPRKVFSIFNLRRKHLPVFSLNKKWMFLSRKNTEI